MIEYFNLLMYTQILVILKAGWALFFFQIIFSLFVFPVFFMLYTSLCMDFQEQTNNENGTLSQKIKIKIVEIGRRPRL